MTTKQAMDSPASFAADLDPNVRSDLELKLREFSLRHASHHRPIALVTSGGTAADLEVNSVRCLDNFSTGLRGAISVEAFLARGYSVIHLTRSGSASPFARVLCNSIGISQANHGLNISSLGRLFAGNTEEDDEDRLVQTVLDEQRNQQHQEKCDPWMTDRSPYGGQQQKQKGRNKSPGGLVLHRRIADSSKIQHALQQRMVSLEEGRLLSVPFRTVEEYLGKLQLCSESLKDSRSLALLYLAAAVSDFYIPREKRSQHKIQSKDHQDEGGFSLQLYPVPKVLGLMKKVWAPDAFMCSFKLETEKSILRQKAECAVSKYGSQMVIGNLLQTRHDEVWVLAPPEQTCSGDSSTDVKDWPLKVITKPKHSEPDVLEGMLIDHVVQTHFEYISTNFDKAGTDAMVRAHEELTRKKERVQREIFWKSVQQTALEYGGIALGAALSYAISSALRRRMDG